VTRHIPNAVKLADQIGVQDLSCTYFQSLKPSHKINLVLQKSLTYSGFLFKELLCFTYEIIQVIVFLLPSRSKNAYFESYKISAKPREIKACGILQSGRFMSEKGVTTFYEFADFLK
jgi:hypothetical protein